MESKKVEIGGRKFILNKIPAYQALKIAIPCFEALKAKDITKISDEVLLQINSYIGVENASGAEIRLSDVELINVNIKDSGMLILADLNMLEYNFDFFFDGSLSREIAKIMGRLGEVKEAEQMDSLKA